MEQQVKNILAGVTNETLEKLAFLFAFPDDERDSDGPQPAIAGRVGFNGFFSGSLVIRIASSVVRELSVNMLGLDDDDEISPEDQQDAFKELLNVICGNALPAIAGDHVEFNIEAPEILSESHASFALNKNKPLCVCRLMIDEGFCDVYFLIEGALPEKILQKEYEQIQ